jgi:hypothetical protein
MFGEEVLRRSQLSSSLNFHAASLPGIQETSRLSPIFRSGSVILTKAWNRSRFASSDENRHEVSIGMAWARLRLNPHPLEPEGAAPNCRRGLIEMRLEAAILVEAEAEDGLAGD